MKTFIKKHNNTILKQHNNQEKPSYTRNTRLCNCRNPEQRPVKGICLQTSILYKARVMTTDNNKTKTYIGITGNDFKTRYWNHYKSLNNNKILKQNQAFKTHLEPERQKNANTQSCGISSSKFHHARQDQGKKMSPMPQRKVVYPKETREKHFEQMVQTI